MGMLGNNDDYMRRMMMMRMMPQSNYGPQQTRPNMMGNIAPILMALMMRGGGMLGSMGNVGGANNMSRNYMAPQDYYA